MKIIPVPVRSDNYAYLIISKGKAVFVDAYDVAAVRAAAAKEGIEDEDVLSLLTTHHHEDHSGGNAIFAKTFPHRPIYGGSGKIPALTNKVQDGDMIQILPDVSVTCLATPCHTQDHFCYYIKDEAVFTGDTLFVSGCGRFFEGTAQEMHKALNTTLANLPEITKVYSGHEYTKTNAQFSAFVMKDNLHVRKLLQDIKDIPITTGIYTIGDEKNHNVFMRVADKAVQQAVGGKDEVDTMQKLREAKNSGRFNI